MTPRDLLGRVSAREVEDADARALKCYRRWEQFGFASPTHKDQARAEDAVVSAQRQSSRLRWRVALLTTEQGVAWALWVLHLLLVRFIRRLSDWLDVGSLPALLAAGVLPLPVACLLGLLLFHSMVSTLLLALGTYFFGVALTALAPYLLPDWIERRPGEVACRLQEERRRKDDATLELARAERHLDDILRQDKVRRAYAEANATYQKLLEAHRCRKAQLLRTDWRSLRDVEFEAFLADVFRELGYRVETTKKTGDQGVDLILSRGRRRVAVQAKGYKDSVGNKAVQEVVAGRLYYECDGCAAVTNSTFTAGAWDLASSVGCLLIEGRDIPDLIRGDIVL
jgi:hypothetical protein